MTVGDIRVSASNRHDVPKSRLLSRYAFSRGEQRLEATALHHVYPVAHRRDLLLGAVFAGTQLYGRPDGKPFEAGGARQGLTALRR